MGTELLPQYHPDVLRAQFSLAHGYIDKVPEKRDVSKGVELLEHVLAIQIKTIPGNHRDILSTQIKSAQVYANHLGKVTKGMRLPERVLKIRSAELPEDNADVLDTELMLGPIYLQNGEFAKVLPLFEKVRKTQGKVFAPDHPFLLGTELMVGQLNVDHTGEVAEGTRMMERGTELLAKSFAEDHTLVLSAQTVLCVNLLGEGWASGQGHALA
jgi:hypothetical protein